MGGMSFYKTPPLIFLALSLALCGWLALRPSAAQTYFVRGLARQGQPLSSGLAERLRAIPLWVVRLWGIVAFTFELESWWSSSWLIEGGEFRNGLYNPVRRWRFS